MISGVYWIPSIYHIVPKYLQGRILMIPLVRICCSTSVSGYHNEYISSTSYHQIMCFMSSNACHYMISGDYWILPIYHIVLHTPLHGVMVPVLPMYCIP